MDETAITLQNLFEQLGLSSEQAAIDAFIDSNRLPEGVKVEDADIWTQAQSQFLKEKLSADDNWAIVIDDLNTRLHQAR